MRKHKNVIAHQAVNLNIREIPEGFQIEQFSVQSIDAFGLLLLLPINCHPFWVSIRMESIDSKELKPHGVTMVTHSE